MPTRFYIGQVGVTMTLGQSAEAQPAQPTAFWPIIPVTLPYVAALRNPLGAYGTTSAQKSVAVNTLGSDALVFVATSDPLAAQTISGTVKGQFLVREANANANFRSQLRIRVVSRDGQTEKAVLYGGDTETINGNPAEEWSTVTQNRRFPRTVASNTLTSYTCDEGDRLVFEVGYRINTTVTTIYAGTIGYGGNTPGDLGENQTDTNTGLNGWLELSQNLVFETRARQLDTFNGTAGTFLQDRAMDQGDGWSSPSVSNIAVNGSGWAYPVGATTPATAQLNTGVPPGTPFAIRAVLVRPTGHTLSTLATRVEFGGSETTQERHVLNIGSSAFNVSRINASNLSTQLGSYARPISNNDAGEHEHVITVDEAGNIAMIYQGRRRITANSPMDGPRVGISYLSLSASTYLPFLDFQVDASIPPVPPLITHTAPDMTAISSSDAASAARTMTAPDTDQTFTSDVATAARTTQASDTDQVFATENATLARTTTASDAVTVGSSDTATGSYTTPLTASDAHTVGSTDSAAAQRHITAPDTDQVVANDNAGTSEAWGASDAHTVGSTDAATVLYTTARTAADAQLVGSTDVASLTSIDLRTAPDTQAVSTSDAASVARTTTAPDTHQVAGTETTSVARITQAADTATATASDASTATRTSTIADTDVVVLSESVTTTDRATVAPDTETVTGSDTATVMRTATATDTQVVAGIDAAFTEATDLRTATDTDQMLAAEAVATARTTQAPDATVVAVAETVTRTSTDLYTAPDTDVVGATENASAARTATATDTGVVTTGDTATARYTTARTAADATATGTTDNATATRSTQATDTDRAVATESVTTADAATAATDTQIVMVGETVVLVWSTTTADTDVAAGSDTTAVMRTATVGDVASPTGDDAASGAFATWAQDAQNVNVVDMGYTRAPRLAPYGTASRIQRPMPVMVLGRTQRPMPVSVTRDEYESPVDVARDQRPMPVAILRERQDSPVAVARERQDSPVAIARDRRTQP